MSKLDAIKKQKEALRAKLLALAAEEKATAAKEKQEAIAAQKKFIEKNKGALASILIKHHSEGFVNFNLDTLIKEVDSILSSKSKTKSPTVSTDSVPETSEETPVISPSTSVETD